MKKLNNVLFIIGLILIPFDNLVIAPSSGWATLTPIVFFIYALLNIKHIVDIYKGNKSLVNMIVGLCVYSVFLYLFYGFIRGNVSDSIITIILGLTFYYSLAVRYSVYERDAEKDIAILIKSYAASFIYGVLKYIALNFKLNSMLYVFQMIEKRYFPRVAFSFTEPSFISIHMFGILLLLYLFSKNQKNRRDIALLILLFSLVTIVSGSSTRYLVDIGVMIIFLFITKIKISKTNIIKYSIGLVVVLLIIILGINYLPKSSRITKIINRGVYADASLASRYFRINASVKGYLGKPVNAFFGAGIGNSYYFFEEGYDKAYKEYKNSYKSEIKSLKDAKPNQLFCLYIRAISEYGIIIFSIIIIYVIRKYLAVKNRRYGIYPLLIIFWIYLQFDSYAFYSLWMLLFYIRYNPLLRDKADRTNEYDREVKAISISTLHKSNSHIFRNIHVKDIIFTLLTILLVVFTIISIEAIKPYWNKTKPLTWQEQQELSLAEIYYNTGNSSGLMIGDSICINTGASSYDKGIDWTLGTMLQSLFETGEVGDWAPLNTGVGTSTISNVLTYLAQTPEKKSPAFSRPYWIIIVGRNDCTKMDVDTFSRLYRSAVKIGVSKGIDVYCVTEPPKINTKSGLVDDKVYPSFRDEIINIAHEEGAILIDVNAEWLRQKSLGRDLKELTNDGIHPNDEGYGIISNLIYQAMITYHRSIINTQTPVINIYAQYQPNSMNNARVLSIDGLTTPTTARQFINNTRDMIEINNSSIEFTLPKGKITDIIVTMIENQNSGVLTVESKNGGFKTVTCLSKGKYVREKSFLINNLGEGTTEVRLTSKGVTYITGIYGIYE